MKKDIPIEKSGIDPLSIKDEERERIAQDLHDELGGPLMKVNMNLELLLKKYPFLSDDFLFEELRYIQGNLFSNIRSTIKNLSAQKIVKNGFLNSMLEFASQYNSPYHSRIHVSCDEDSIVDFSDETKIQLFRLLQELVNNSLKHSHAWKIWIVFIEEEKELILHYKDDGIGFKDTANSGNPTFYNIRQRVTALEAKMDMLQGSGCNVKIMIPKYYENTSCR